MTRFGFSYISAVLLSAYAVACLTVALFGHVGVTKIYALRHELSDYQLQNEHLSSDINDLQAKIQAMNSAAWQENQARVHLGMIKSRETYYQIKEVR